MFFQRNSSHAASTVSNTKAGTTSARRVLPVEQALACNRRFSSGFVRCQYILQPRALQTACTPQKQPPARTISSVSACPPFFVCFRIRQAGNILLLACVFEIASDMTLHESRRDPAIVPDEFVRESRAGKSHFRLRNDRLWRTSVHADEECTARETNRYRA